MGDLGLISPELLLARIDVERDAQMLVIEGKELRIAELEADSARIQKDSERVEREAAEIAKTIAKTDDALEAKRLSIRKHEFEHVGKKNHLRLLELAEERAAIASDIASSQAQIARLEAEESQQTVRLKESRHG